MGIALGENMQNTETRFESTTKSNSTEGNGKLLIVRGGQILSKDSSGNQVKSALLTGEDNALIGTYEGSVANKFDPAKLDQKIRMEDGTLVIMSETANLRRGFANVSEGELVRVVYGGKRTMTKGKNAGKSVHDFDVQRAINTEE